MLKSTILYLILLLIITLFLVWQMTAFKAPEPNYHVLKNDGDIQVRGYPALIVAQVEVSGKRAAAISAGFRLLADYIFGKNDGGRKIEMTAPVIQEGSKIPMTAPVLQEKKNEQWVVRFIMPNSFTLQTLPKPNNKLISLIALPVKKYVAIRFSGMSTQANLDSHQKKLMAYISNHHLNTSGDPIYAFYNPPWILPFLRRNEIMIELH
ncbi:MAG: heme-binding protein [Gammaproteobacteria bacterium]|nr:heme-binding protein [Gammaproteobacteria bacterium]